MMGFVVFNPNDYPVQLVHGYVGGREWMYVPPDYEQMADIDDCLNTGLLIKVEAPSRSTALSAGAQEAFNHLWDEEDLDASKKASPVEAVQEEPKQTAPKRKAPKVRDTEAEQSSDNKEE